MTENTTKTISVPRWAQVTVASAILLIICIHLIYPKLAIDSITVSLLVLLLAVWFLPWVKALKIPGGTEIQMREVVKVEESLSKIDLARRPQPPTNLANAAMEGVDVDRTPLRELLLEQDPNLALAGLRIEIEKHVRDLARKRGILVRRDNDLLALSRALRRIGILDTKVESSLSEIVGLCNRAVHGAQVGATVARRTIAIGEELLSILESLAQFDGK